jgi:hypothetical protein
MPERGPQPTEADPATEGSSPHEDAVRFPGSALTEPQPESPGDKALEPVSPWSRTGEAAYRSTPAEEPSPADGAEATSWPEDADADPDTVEPDLGFSVIDSGSPQDTARPPSRTRKVVLTSILAVALVGVAVLGWAGWQITSQKNATMTTPAQIAGLHLDDSQSGRDTADYMLTALSAEVDLDQAVGAVYTDSANHDVLFFGGTTLIWSPSNDLKTAFGLISDDQGAVTNVHDVPAGEYGGTMRCGTTQTADGAMPVCGWADHGSLALAMFPNRSEAESAKLLLEIRDAAQKRN